MSKVEDSIRAIQKALDLLRSVNTLDGADKDFLEQQLETALRILAEEPTAKLNK